MKFFISNARDETHQNEIYTAIWRFAMDTLGWKFTERRVFSVRYRHKVHGS